MGMFYVNVTVHILAAMVWLGGMLFLGFVAAPALRKVDNVQLRASLFTEVGKKFRTVGWWSIVVLVITGLGNLHFRGFLNRSTLESSFFWSSRYGHSLIGKLLCVAAMLVIQVVHDRKHDKWSGRISTVIGVVLVYFAVRLARGG